MEKPMRLLSLDGGGVRGLSSLYILQDIMARIKVSKGLPTEPLPCDYFDIIGGTSTGGIIAIMLGRLRMSTTQCIVAYRKLSSAVFGEKQNWWKETTYSAKRLEEVVANVVEDHTGDKKSALLDDRNECKVFVTAVKKRAMGDEPVLIRSFTSPTTPINCTITEAARATSAAPTFFPSIQIGEEEYVDGGLGNNNPAMIVIQEGQRLWKSANQSRELPSILVSIGTGREGPVQLKKSTVFPSLGERSGVSCAKALAEMITSSEEIERTFKAWVDERSIADRYYRFNVLSGLSGVDLDSCDLESRQQITSVTKSYLQKDASADIEKCSTALDKATNPTTTPAHSEPGEQAPAPTQDNRSSTNPSENGGPSPNQPSSGATYNTYIAGRNINNIGSIGFAKFD